VRTQAKIIVANLKKKRYFMTMKFTTTLTQDEDGVWIAECPAIPGCVSQGSSRDEATINLREAIALCLEVRAERGMPLTVETREIEVAV
jgi:predicted RNase H-like HicB family nuclease